MDVDLKQPNEEQIRDRAVASHQAHDRQVDINIGLRSRFLYEIDPPDFEGAAMADRLVRMHSAVRDTLAHILGWNEAADD